MYKYVTTEEIQKEWRTKDQVQKEEGTLHVIMSKERSVVKNNFWTKFTYSFRESLQSCIQAQNDSGQPLWTLRKISQK